MPNSYPSNGQLVSSDPLAPSLFEQSKADRAAAQFDLTDREYLKIANVSDAAQEWFLMNRLGEFDGNRRQIIGVWGSIGGAGERRFWAEWHANRTDNLARAWEAFSRAELAFGSQVAA